MPTTHTKRSKSKPGAFRRFTFRADDTLATSFEAYCADRELMPSQVMRLALKQFLGLTPSSKKLG